MWLKKKEGTSSGFVCFLYRREQRAHPSLCEAAGRAASVTEVNNRANSLFNGLWINYNSAREKL